MSYVARRNLHEDQVLVFEAGTLEGATEGLVSEFLEYANGLLSTSGHRLYHLMGACEELAAEGDELMELLGRAGKHDFDWGPLVHGMWEVHRT